MNIDIIKERETPLLSRKRVTLNVEYEAATPARLILKKAIAKKLGSREELTIIRHVYTKFGRQKAKVIVNVYQNEKDMKAVEEEHLLGKHQEKKEGDKAEQKEESKGEKKE